MLKNIFCFQYTQVSLRYSVLSSYCASAWLLFPSKRNWLLPPSWSLSYVSTKENMRVPINNTKKKINNYIYDKKIQRVIYSHERGGYCDLYGRR